jgi:hypothetical protein
MPIAEPNKHHAPVLHRVVFSGDIIIVTLFLVSGRDVARLSDCHPL